MGRLDPSLDNRQGGVDWETEGEDGKGMEGEEGWEAVVKM